MEPELIEGLNVQIATAAYAITRRFRGFVEQADVHQMLWEWALRHHAKIEKWRKDNDDDGAKVIASTLYDEAHIYARKAKAAAQGYSAADEFFYTKNLIEDLLPIMFNKEEWLNPPTEHGNQRSGKTLSEGNNWMATLSDVARSYAKLSEDDQWLLQSVFEHETPKRQLADLFQITPKGVDHRIERAVKRLWRHLGGPKWLAPEERQGRVENPVGTRRAMSNATARAVTDNQWDPS